MKRWTTYTLAVTFVACSQGPGNTAHSAAACEQNSSRVQSQASENAPASISHVKGAHQPADPFKTQGKVVIDGVSHVNGTSAIQSFNQGQESTMAAGTELTVTLRTDCEQSGELARQIRSAKSQKAAGRGVRSYEWQLPNEMSLSQLKELAAKDSCVEGISNSTPSYVNDAGEPPAVGGAPAAGADPLVEQQGHLKMLEVLDTSKMVFNSDSPMKPITIAVVDTGIDMTHDDLKDVLWTNPNEIPENKVDDDNNGFVDDVNGYNFSNDTPSPKVMGGWSGSQHGTHVAGLAAAQGGNSVGGAGVMGVNARIMMLNAFGAHPSASSSDVANAIRYAADNGAEVINLSLGSYGRNATQESAIVYAISKGSTVVVAAGNDGKELNDSFYESPGSLGGVHAGLISVGSIDSSTLAISRFSNYSPKLVEIVAPGSEESYKRRGLLSTWPGNKYSRIQGTSMASPVAAGAAAMAIYQMRAHGHNPDPATVETVVEQSGSVLPAMLEKIKEGRVLNLKSLTEYVAKNYPPQAAPAGDPAGDTCDNTEI